jgi:septum formation protein
MARGDRLEHRLSVSDVRFRALSAEEIRRYVQSGDPMDKAGAYGIQGRAATFVEEIRGSHSGIVGLPLCETALLLREFGYPI